MFPKSEGANIGLGIQKSFAKGKSLNKYSSEFIDKYDGETTFKGAGSLPMSELSNDLLKKIMCWLVMLQEWYYRQMVQE